VDQEPFQRKRTALTLSMGRPHHGVIDAVVGVGEPAVMQAKFSYGGISKDLSEEKVAVFRGGLTEPGACATWQPAHALTTDTNGVARVEVPPSDQPGRFPLAFVVVGDGSAAMGNVWVLRAAQPVVVFDVDGTLTEGDEALIEQVLTGVSPPARAGAAEVARRHVALGAIPIYVTGRPSFLAGLTRAWLSEHGFPEGPVLTTETRQEAMPTADGVQRFKQHTLTDLGQRGRIERAYGNAITDVCAYRAAGIPPENTFIVGTHAGSGCDGGPPTQAVRSYRDLLSTLQ
jgi:phosphatidate phosphatase PAH1